MPETLTSLGETEVLQRIFPRLPHADLQLLGPGDDAAVISTPDARSVVTTDTMHQGPDFRLAWSSALQLGWKAAATNLADIAAMGARPTALLVALLIPGDTRIGWLEEFADGLRLACETLAPGCGVVGGDLSAADAVTVAVTAFGDLLGSEPVRRSGARGGDVLAVSGELGLAAAGIRLLFEHAVDGKGAPSASLAGALRPKHDRELDAQLQPSPPIGDGVAAALAGASAMLDVSDGLALDARRLAKASGVTLDIDSATLRHPLALTGGEDHALLATFPSQATLPGSFRMIGRVLPGSAALLVDGHPFVERGGWDPYRDWDGISG